MQRALMKVDLGCLLSGILNDCSLWTLLLMPLMETWKILFEGALYSRLSIKQFTFYHRFSHDNASGSWPTEEQASSEEDRIFELSLSVNMVILPLQSLTAPTINPQRCCLKQWQLKCFLMKVKRGAAGENTQQKNPTFLALSVHGCSGGI